MPKLDSIVLFIALPLAIGCKKKDDAGAGSPAGSGSSAAAATTDTVAGCGAGKFELPGPHICAALPDGYDKPVKLDSAKDPSHGQMRADWSKGGQTEATLQLIYNDPSQSASWDFFAKYQTTDCDSPPTIEDIAGGKGKYFKCVASKIDGKTVAKSLIKFDDKKNRIECSTIEKGHADVDDICKSITQQ